MGQARHLGVLLGDAFGGVDQDQAHVAALNGQGGPENGILLDVLLHLGLAADAGGVNEDEPALIVFKVGVDGVSGGAGHVGDDDPLLPQDLVHQGGLASVGLADNSHLDGVVLLLFFLLWGEVLETGVQQVAGAVAMDSRDSDGIPQSQVVELIKVRVRDTGGVHFVHCQHDGLAAAQQHVGHLLVRGGEARADIRQKDDDSGVLDGDLGLIPHEGQDLVVGPGLDTAGVDKGEGPAVPVRLPIDAVPGDARGVLHNGEALSNEFVEQHGLAHIGPAHDGDDGFHRRSLPFFIKQTYMVILYPVTGEMARHPPIFTQYGRRKRREDVALPSRSTGHVLFRHHGLDNLDLAAVVSTALLAHSVRQVQRTAFRAFDEAGSRQLPVGAAALVASSFGYFSLRYCHCDTSLIFQRQRSRPRPYSFVLSVL